MIYFFILNDNIVKKISFLLTGFHSRSCQQDVNNEQDVNNPVDILLTRWLIFWRSDLLVELWKINQKTKQFKFIKTVMWFYNDQNMHALRFEMSKSATKQQINFMQRVFVSVWLLFLLAGKMRNLTEKTLSLCQYAKESTREWLRLILVYIAALK